MKDNNKQLLDIAEIIKTSFESGFKCGTKICAPKVLETAFDQSIGNESDIMSEIDDIIHNAKEDAIGKLLAKYLPKTDMMSGNIR